MDEVDPGAVPAPAWPGGEGRFHGRDRVEALRDGLGLDAALTRPWRPGEAAAYKQLYDFVEHHLGDYKAYRDFPSEPATSTLSTALSAGTLAPLDAYLAARRAMGDAAAREGAATWIGELAWRDFYRQIMHRFPSLAKGTPFRPETRLLAWNDNDEHFQAWCEGRTGYPWWTRPCDSWSPPAGCTTGCACSPPCSSPSTCSLTGARESAFSCGT